MARKLNIVLLSLLLLVGAPFWWLLFDNQPGNPQPQPITVAQLRALAHSKPGPAPASIHAALVGWRFAPRAALVAGSGLKTRLVGIIAYRLDVPGGAPIVIDSGITPAGAKALGLERLDLADVSRVDHWLDDAGLVLFTHEHLDHMGAFVARLGGANAPALLAKARFNPAQLPPAPLAASLGWPAGLALPMPAIRPGAPQAVAPGVVVIPTPSHTPGSQMIFVRLGDGREYLFAGDVASMSANWKELRGRSRLVSQYAAGQPEDRPAVFSWLATIRKWHEEAPDMAILPGHDWRTIASQPGHMGIDADFSDTPPPRD